jgi:hypothetical protein
LKPRLSPIFCVFTDMSSIGISRLTIVCETFAQNVAQPIFCPSLFINLSIDKMAQRYELRL